MSNFKMTERLKRLVIQEVDRLVNLRTTCAEQGFPVPVLKIVQATAPEWARASLRQLREAGAQSIRQTQTIFACIAGEGVTRPALVQMTMPVWVDYLFEAQSSPWSAAEAFQGSRMNRKHLPFDLALLDEGERKSLVSWVNAAVSEHRIAAGTRRVVEEFITRCSSLAHLDARWPDLKVVFQKFPEPWPDRIRNLPRTKRREWGWPSSGPDYEWWQKNELKMAAAANVLVGATLIDRPVEKFNQGVPATVVDWEGRRNKS